MKKYLKDGRKVNVVIETIDGNFVVRTIISVDAGYDSAFEYESDNVFVISKDELCNLPPTEIFEKSVATLKDDISKKEKTAVSLKNEISELEGKLTKIKRELSDRDMETAHTINQLGRFVDNPTMLIDYFLGVFTHIVIEDCNWPGLEKFDEVNRKRIDLTLKGEGKRRVCLAVKVNSDCWRTGIPCKSEGEALALLKKKIEYVHCNRPGVMIKEAKKYGITVDKKYIDKYNEIKEKEREKKRRELEKEIRDLK